MVVVVVVKRKSFGVCVVCGWILVIPYFSLSDKRKGR